MLVGGFGGECLEWRDQIFQDGRICYSAEPLGSARGTRGLVDADAGVLNKIDETQMLRCFRKNLHQVLLIARAKL